MKLTIVRKDFLQMLSFAQQAIAQRSEEKSFANFLIEVSESNVCVIASNGVIATRINYETSDSDNESGAFQVNAKLLTECISKMNGNDIALYIKDNNLLHIKDDRSYFDLVTQKANEFPNVSFDINEKEESNGDRGFTLTLNALKELYSATSYAVAKAGPKELLYGVNIKANEDSITFSATDSYRLVAKTLHSVANQHTNFEFTCPVEALNMVSKIDKGEEIKVYFDDTKALFKTDNIAISTRLLKGAFPDVSRFIPPLFKYKFVVNANDFINATERAKIMSEIGKDHNCLVKLILKDNCASLHSSDHNYGNSQEDLKASVDLNGDEIFEIGFNANYVLDAIKALNSESVEFGFNSATKLFKVGGDEDTIQIVTPIRI